MSTLQIKQLESGAFEHVDSIDGSFFLGRFNFKREFDKAFLVEAYGAKRRTYGKTAGVIDISVTPFGGSEETFTNWNNLENRLTELGYTGIDTNGTVIPSNGILVTDATVTGSYNIDWRKDTYDLILTGNTTLTESNLPAVGFTKVISLYISGNFTISYPVDWTDFITGAYDGLSALNKITVEFINTGRYNVTITQPD